MGDPNKDPTVKRPSQPEIKPPALEDFKGVLGWVEGKKEESKKSGKPWGWVTGLIAAVVVFIALAFAAYTMWKKGQEIAKLKHKIDVDEEAKKQAKVDAKLQKNVLERENLKKEAANLQANINKNTADIAKAELDRKEEQAKINRISSWEDVDQL